MEKLRKDDFLYSFFMAPGGSVIWIVRRKGEIFVSAIMNMRSWMMYHFPYEHNEREATAGITAITQTLNLIGFTEYSVFAEVRQAEGTEFVKALQSQFEMFDKAAESAQAEAKKRADEAVAKASAAIAEEHGMVPVGDVATGATPSEAAAAASGPVLKVLPPADAPADQSTPAPSGK